MGKNTMPMPAGRVLVLSFLFVIIVGFLLLSLPCAQKTTVHWFDLMFTAVSVTCVTGLSVISLESFTWIGHAVILMLMQIGGIGLMTFSLFVFSLFSQFGLATTVMTGKLLDFELMNRIKYYLGMVVLTTVCVEIIGACLLYSHFSGSMIWYQALFYAFFYSVSAFCNAGICLTDTSLQSMQGDLGLLSILAILAFVGGIGFVVWYEVGERVQYWFLKYWYKERRIHAFSLHTKLVVSMSLALLLLGTLIYAVNEWSYAWKDLVWYEKIFQSFFMSVVSRSAGFVTVAIESLRPITLLSMMGLMFVGGSPSSTAGGIKTTTIAILVATMISVMKGRLQVEAFGRELVNDQVYKAVAIVLLGLCWIGLTAWVLLFFETQYSFLDIFFESLSAFTTVGFSRGITPFLAVESKIMLMASMLVGRIGALTLILAIRRSKDKKSYTFAQERVLIG